MKYVLLLIGLLISSSLFAQVNWQTLDWQQAKYLARKENKILFVDCETTWCGWCKTMDEKTFTDPEVVKLMNDHFVSIKIDGDTPFGLDLRHKFNIPGYPTYLLFDSAADVMKICVGYHSAKPFLFMLEQCADTATQEILKGYSQKIPEDCPSFLLKAWKFNNNPESYEITSFLDDTSKRFSECYYDVLSKYYWFHDKYFQILLSNRKQYRVLYGKENVDHIILTHYRKIFDSSSQSANEEKFDDLMQTLSSYELTSDKEVIIDYKMEFYEQTENWQKLLEAMQYDIKLYGVNAFKFNDYCWSIYEDCNDEVLLKQACEIMEESMETYPRYVELDTYAALLYKSKSYDHAQKVATEAIETGKREGLDISDTETLLANIQAAQN